MGPIERTLSMTKVIEDFPKRDIPFQLQRLNGNDGFGTFEVADCSPLQPIESFKLNTERIHRKVEKSTPRRRIEPPYLV